MAFSRMIWKTTPPTPTSSGSWDYWGSIIEDLFSVSSSATSTVFTCRKYANRIGYYTLIYGSFQYGGGLVPILLSPNADAVWFRWGQTSTRYDGTITDINGNTWYYAVGDQYYGYSDPTPSKNCILNDTIYAYGNESQAAQELLNRVFATPFQNTYTSGQTYNLTFTDTRKTIRKALSAMLHRNMSLYGTNDGYTALSDNADTIINWIMQQIANKGYTNTAIYVSIATDDIQVGFGTANHAGVPSLTQIPNASVNNTAAVSGYTYYDFVSPDMEDPTSYWGRYDNIMDADWVADVMWDSNTNDLVYTLYDAYDGQFSAGQIPYRAGIKVETYFGNEYVSLTNIGIDL